MDPSKDKKEPSQEGYLEWPGPTEVAGFTEIPATPEIVYPQGSPTVSPKRGRNDVCWCGNGKKYKKCHLAADQK